MILLGAILWLVADHVHVGEVGRFYDTWMMPSNRNVSCCHKQDCAAAEAYQKDGYWYARKIGEKEYTRVPKDHEEHDRDSPDGRNHLCARPNSNTFLGGNTTVFCFIEGNGT